MAILTRETTATGVTNNNAPLTNAELDNNFVELVADIADKAALTDLSVTTNAAGTAALSYSNSTGTFTYTPPDLSGYQTSATLNEDIDDRVAALLQAGNGIALDYDDVNNELAISSEVTEITAYNGTGSTLTKGTVVYQSGVQGTNISVAAASNSSASTMPAVGIVIADIANAATGQIAVAGLVRNLDTSSFTAGDVLYVGTSGALTATKPTGESNLIQNFGRALKINASSGEVLVLGAGRTNDVPNLADGNVFIGNASNVAEKRALAADDIASGTFADARIAESNVTQHQAALSITESQISDFGTYLTSFTETNDLTAAVTWANVPNANITQSSVTQHQAALSITESQISDFGTYLTTVALNDVSDVVITSLSSGQILKYNGTNWVNDADAGGIALTDLSVTTNAAGTAALSYNNTTGVFSYTPPDLSSYLTSYTETDPTVPSHVKSITTTEKANWNTAYGWGNHASAGYLTSYTESDPVFTASAASGITSTNISNWNTAYGWGNHASAGYLPRNAAAYNGTYNIPVVVSGATLYDNPNGGAVTITGSTGSLTASGNITAYSDERLKSDIETLDGSKVYEMRGVSFTKDGEAGSGVIAQELQKVAPELVIEGDEYLSVAYGNLVGYLIEAVKELKAEIEELKNASPQ